MSQEKILLTQYARSSGCGCKIGPAVLDEILQNHRNSAEIPQMLIGNEKNDDASVWDLGDGSVLLSTTDFFMPLVDDAFDFGAVASTNALSDIYAMGGEPLFALAILGWPIDVLPASEAARVLDGARSMCEKAGIPITGGHTIDSKEPFFGLAVTGRCAANQIRRNVGAQAGDLIYLTKPLGTGMVSTLARRGQANPEFVAELITQMTTLNKVGTSLGKLPSVHAMTDVTGFGLLGHLTEMLKDSNLTAQLRFNDIPRLAGVETCLKSFVFPDMTTRTYNWIKDDVSELSGDQLLLLCDPQTSGGLLIAVASADKVAIEAVLTNSGCEAKCIGYFEEFSGKAIFVKDR